MTVNEFNCKVNLPYVYELCGKVGYQFVKLPHFGWYAYNKDYSEVRQFFDGQFANVSDRKAVSAVLTDLLKNKKHYFDHHVYYTDMAVNQLYADIFLMHKMHEIYRYSQGEILNQPALIDKQPVQLVDKLSESGMPFAIEAGIGLCTPRLVKFAEQNKIPMSSRHHYKLIVPTFSTPKHISSLEYCTIANLQTDRTVFWQNFERGWYGNIQNNILVPNFAGVTTTKAITWDHKLNYWMTSPLILHHSLNTAECLRIWTQAKLVKFDKSPLRAIAQSQDPDQLRNYLKDLSIAQVEELEKYFGIQLLESWKNQKQEECSIGDLTFVRKDNQYWVIRRNGEYEEFTNFTMTITRIYKQESEYFREGFITYGNQDYAFVFPNSNFTSAKVFTTIIHDFFMKSGIGVPIISVRYKHYLLDIIARFNRSIPVT